MPDYEKDARDTARYLGALKAAGAAALSASLAEPPAGAGIFADALPVWTPGQTYGKNQPFSHKDCVGYAKADGTFAQEHQPPFSQGTEAVYGARPTPGLDGVYPYVYNMAADTGMLVREDGVVYECYHGPVEDMLWPPSQLAAHFRVYTPETV